MKNKKALIPIFAGIISLIGLTAFVLLYGDNQKVSGPTNDELKPAVFKDISDSTESIDEGYPISRVNASPADYFEKQSLSAVSDMKAYEGLKRLQPTVFLSTSIYDKTFDIVGFTGKKVKYGTYNGAYILQADDCFQIEIVKIADDYTTKLHQANESATLVADYELIVEEYEKECQTKTEKDELDIYDDSKDGGLFTYAPYYSFFLKNDLKYEMDIYTANDYRAILSKFYAIPEDYVYSASRKSGNGAYMRTGSFKSIKTNEEGAYTEYYLLYNYDGVYAVRLYYTEDAHLDDYGNEYLNLPTVFDFVAPRCTDSQLYLSSSKMYDDGESYKETNNVFYKPQKAKFTEADILTPQKAKEGENGRIYIERSDESGESGTTEREE